MTDIPDVDSELWGTLPSWAIASDLLRPDERDRLWHAILHKRSDVIWADYSRRNVTAGTNDLKCWQLVRTSAACELLVQSSQNDPGWRCVRLSAQRRTDTYGVVAFLRPDNVGTATEWDELVETAIREDSEERARYEAGVRRVLDDMIRELEFLPEELPAIGPTVKSWWNPRKKPA